MKFIFSVILLMMLDSATGQAYKLRQFEDVTAFVANNNDTLYVINFWATWCKPCVEEIPSFEKLNEAYSGKPVKIILLSLDTEKQWEGSLVPFLQKNNLKTEVWVMPNKKPVDWIDQINPKWQGSIPATFIFNNNKNISIFEEHPFTYEELSNILIQHNYLTN
ncbi:MAG: TlpA disulfide reductase family protein [Chitinophagales bacterium]